jgi:hypothetical protein
MKVIARTMSVDMSPTTRRSDAANSSRLEAVMPGTAALIFWAS